MAQLPVVLPRTDYYGCETDDAVVVGRLRIARGSGSTSFQELVRTSERRDGGFYGCPECRSLWTRRLSLSPSSRLLKQGRLLPLGWKPISHRLRSQKNRFIGDHDTILYFRASTYLLSHSFKDILSSRNSQMGVPFPLQTFLYVTLTCESSKFLSFVWGCTNLRYDPGFGLRLGHITKCSWLAVKPVMALTFCAFQDISLYTFRCRYLSRVSLTSSSTSRCIMK
jgi:hypothetical protein